MHTPLASHAFSVVQPPTLSSSKTPPSPQKGSPHHPVTTPPTPGPSNHWAASWVCGFARLARHIKRIVSCLLLGLASFTNSTFLSSSRRELGSGLIRFYGWRAFQWTDPPHLVSVFVHPRMDPQTAPVPGCCGGAALGTPNTRPAQCLLSILGYKPGSGTSGSCGSSRLKFEDLPNCFPMFTLF